MAPKRKPGALTLEEILAGDPELPPPKHRAQNSDAVSPVPNGCDTEVHTGSGSRQAPAAPVVAKTVKKADGIGLRQAPANGSTSTAPVVAKTVKKAGGSGPHAPANGITTATALVVAKAVETKPDSKPGRDPEKGLQQLTQNFYHMVCNAPTGLVDLTEATKTMGIAKRCAPLGAQRRERWSV